MVALHDAPLVGHPCFYNTYKLLKERFTWKGLKEDVLQHVRECVTYQENKFEKANDDLTRNNLFTGRLMGMLNPMMRILMTHCN